MEMGTMDRQETREETEARVAAEEEGLDTVEHDSGGEDEEDDGETIELRIEGDGQLTLTVGGAKPETSTVVLIGGKMDVSGGDFDKGQEVKLLIHGIVSEVAFIDSRDQYGNISGTERKHKVRPLRVERLRD